MSENFWRITTFRWRRDYQYNWQDLLLAVKTKSSFPQVKNDKIEI